MHGYSHLATERDRLVDLRDVPRQESACVDASGVPFGIGEGRTMTWRDVDGTLQRFVELDV